MFVYSVCRPKLVVNICINWLRIFVNLSVILGSQYSLNLLLLSNKCLNKIGKKERINLIVVVDVKTGTRVSRISGSIASNRHYKCDR